MTHATMLAEPNFVLLHGFGTSSREWAHVAEDLGGLRPLHPDLPGFGTCAQEGAHSLEDMARHVREAIERAGYERVVLVGHDLGAWVAATLARGELPGLVGVALVSPIPTGRKALPSAHGDREALRAYYEGVARTPLSERDLENLVMDGLRASPEAWRAWVDAPPPGLDAPLPVPTLVLLSTEDPNDPDSFPEDARVELIEDAGALLPLEAPKTLTRHLLHWANNTLKEASA